MPDSPQSLASSALRLAGLIAVVTGAAAGIGRACALAYASAGAKVVVSDIDRTGGEAAAGEIASAGGTARFVAADVGKSEECARLIADAASTYGRVDILHANAGIELCKSVWDTTDEDWHRVLGVNLGGAFFTAREAMRDMRSKGTKGSIILTASPHAFMTSREIAAYAASKGGQVALMRALALEGAPFGIRANAILPGAIETPMLHREAAFSPDPVEQLKRFAEAHPISRLGQPEDVAKVAVFLASDDASFVTGSCFAVDGGLMASVNSGPSISYTNG
ncbi:MAG: SDR family oxidoreductase [Alphaproteobacteria bacterium]|nr:SDR family oxidoreductase [Alphaproteobacteria bacterium]